MFGTIIVKLGVIHYFYIIIIRMRKSKSALKAERQQKANGSCKQWERNQCINGNTCAFFHGHGSDGAAGEFVARGIDAEQRRLQGTLFGSFDLPLGTVVLQQGPITPPLGESLLTRVRGCMIESAAPVE